MLFTIYIFTVLFSILQYVVNTIKTIIDNRKLKTKNKETYEDILKEAEDMYILESFIKKIEFILRNSFLTEIFVFILCFVPVINILIAILNLASIFNLEIKE